MVYRRKSIQQSIQQVYRRNSEQHEGVRRWFNLRLSYVSKQPKDKKIFSKGLCGLGLMFLAMIMYLCDPVALYSKFYLRMAKGTTFYNMWEKPPIAAYIKCYIFNVTNSDEFLRGDVDKVKVEEVGPFTYLEIRSNEDMFIDSEKGILRFTPHRDVKFVPEMSIGQPKDYILNVPNVPFLALSSLVADKSYLMSSVNLLAWSLNTKVMLNLTADQYLWGYEDRLVHSAHALLPFWIDFKKFGILDRMYDDKRVSVEVELADESRKYSINSWDGLGGMPLWGYTEENNTRCNQLNGTYEGLLFKPNIKPSDSLTMYRKQICRTLQLKYSKEHVTEFGVKTFMYEPVEDSFDPTEENKCMCLNGACLKRGLSNLAPCYYGLPVAMSWPHFYNADPNLSERIIGMKPDPEEHKTIIEIEPIHGVPLSMVSSTQSNLVIGNIPGSALGRKFSNMVLPIIWMKMELQPIPEDYKTLLRWLYIHGPNLMTALEILMGVAGILLVLIQIFTLMRRPEGLTYDIVLSKDNNNKEEKGQNVHLI